MKKTLFLIISTLFSLAINAQAVVSTEDGKYPAYCDVMGYNFWGIGKVKVLLDFGAVSQGGGEFETLQDENGKTIKFHTMIEALNYMGKRGWKVTETYLLTENTGLSSSNVIHYLLMKMVSDDSQIREGIKTQKTEDAEKRKKKEEQKEKAKASGDGVYY